jgi:cytochrome c556
MLGIRKPQAGCKWRITDMIRCLLAVALVALGISTLYAQTDPVEARKALMKANGEQARIAYEMFQGKRPFDLNAAKRAFAVFAEAGEKAPALFPDPSKTGDALPAVWMNKADFEAKLANLARESRAAAEATKDFDSFKAQFGKLRKDCVGCHQTYRKKAI